MEDNLPVVDLEVSSMDEDGSISGYDTEKERLEAVGSNNKKVIKSRSIIKKKETRNYVKSWENDPALKSWIAPCKTSRTKARCKYCQIDLRAHLGDLKKHAKYSKHLQTIENEQKRLSMSNITTFAKPLIADEQKIAELRIATYIAESSTAFRKSDSLIAVIKAVSKKDETVKKMKLGRTKCTKLITKVLGPGFRKLIVDDIGSGKYSLLIDESTDVSSWSIVCLVLRYTSLKKRKIITTFYRLVRLEGGKRDASAISDGIISALKEDGLSIQNIVGLGSDSAPVLTGYRNGVIAKFKEQNSEIVLVPCICHSLHNSAKYAFEKLPSHLETLVKGVYNYFAHSGSRKERYNELYEKINNSSPKKLLKLHNVRWLSLLQCVDSILKQWDELVQFFTSESSDGNYDQRYDARMLSEMLTDKRNKVYLYFARSFLKPIVDKNLLFQTEDGDVLKLITELDMFYISLLRRFVVTTQLDIFLRSKSDLMEFQFEGHCCHIDMVDFGAECFEKLMDIEIVKERDAIKERCRSCLVEAARQVRNRLPNSLKTLRLLESLSPSTVILRKYENILPLLQRFRSLTPDIESAYREFRDLSDHYSLSDTEGVNSVDFWFNVFYNTDVAGNSRFENIATFALNLFSLPFSNACVERVFSAMALVKTNLRNRLHVEPVEAVLAVRYGLKFMNATPESFEPPKDMLKLFNADIYEKHLDNEVEIMEFEDVYAALNAVENL